MIRRGPIRMLSNAKPSQLSFKSALARNTGWMLVGQGFRLVVQAFYFIVIARSLGPMKYGAFVGVVGMVGIFHPFGALGSGYLLIKNVARDPGQFSENWGRALSTTFLSTSILFAVVLVVSRFVLPLAIPLRLVAFVAGSDLFAVGVIDLSGQAFQACDRLHWTASINGLLSTSRFLAAVILVALHQSPSPLQWGGFYFGSTSLVAMVAFSLVLVKLGAPTFNFSQPSRESWEGFYFSVSQSAQTIYNDIDKTMLARLGTLEATGIYGAAYRLIDVSFAPVWSLLAAAYPNFFRVGVGGISATLQYAKPLILHALGYAVFVAIAVLTCAGLVPVVLGGEYRLTVEALRWLAIIPMLRVVHFFLSDALAGAGYQALRSSFHVGVAVFNVLINLWIIPAYSWRGAAWSSIASDALLACSIGAAVLILSRRSRGRASDADVVQVRAEA